MSLDIDLAFLPIGNGLGWLSWQQEGFLRPPRYDLMVHHRHQHHQKRLVVLDLVCLESGRFVVPRCIDRPSLKKNALKHIPRYI